MFVKHLRDCAEFIAGDGSVLREVFHPAKEQLKVNYSLAYAKVLPGEKTLRHRLLKSGEVYYVIEGEGVMHIDSEQAHLTAGSSVYIPPQAVQYIENKSDKDLIFLCLVTPPWQAEDEEVLKKK